MSKRQRVNDYDLSVHQRVPLQVSGSLQFQILDLDVCSGWPYGSNDYHLENGLRTIIRVYGVDQNGNSVLVNVHNFFPYFYTRYDGNEQSLAHAINKHFPDTVIGIERVNKISLWGYEQNPHTDYIKVTLISPNKVTDVANLLQDGILISGTVYKLPIFETKLPFILRLMVDCNLSSWAQLHVYSEVKKRRSTCQIELDCDYRDLVPIQDKLEIAPIRILSFDIECLGRKGFFPVPEIDPVIQISCIISTINEIQSKVIFTVLDCDPIDGVAIFSFGTEEELFEAFLEYWCYVDPDVITGYNIQNFDIPYIVKRGRHLGIEVKLGRMHKTTNFKKKFGEDDKSEEEKKNEESLRDQFKELNVCDISEDEDEEMKQILDDYCPIFDENFRHNEKQSKNKIFQKPPTEEEKKKGLQKGKFRRNDIETLIEGRIQLDCLLLIAKENRDLRSYTLNAVSAHFLGQEKEDVHHSQIAVLQNGSNADRKRLAAYCVKDSVLCILLIQKLMLMVNLIGMSRVTGVTINFLLTRGEQIKAISQLFRFCFLFHIIIPTLKFEKAGEKFDGATVIEPKKGFYKVPIDTLDFNSLYPSIMMAWNLCYTTLVNDVSGMDPNDYFTTPIGKHFVKPHVKKGILPSILKKLLDERAATRVLMKTEKDPLTLAVLNGRQLALKISANSIYGFTGAQIGLLPCLAISSSVTGYGRQMIFKAKEYVEKTYTKKNGYQHDADVIYGDTDSIMVKFGVETVQEAIDLGIKAAEEITKLFPSPIKIIWEKSLFPYLLLAKKRYAGMYWTNSIKPDKMHMSGIETVRRDTCKLVGSTLQRVLDKLMIDQDVDGAVALVKEVLSNLLQNKIDFNDLVISKGLTKEKYEGKQVHDELRKRMLKRDKASAPRVGDRVPYVIIQGDKKSAVSDRGESPMYALQNDLPIDYTYYIENQLKMPLTRIFEHIISEEKMYSLFHGKHMKTMVKQTPKVGGIASFVVKLKSCLECRVLIEEGNLCEECSKNKVLIHSNRSKQKENALQMYEKTKEICYTCQGSRAEIICQSTDCEVFFRRFKQKKDLDKITQQMLEF